MKCPICASDEQRVERTARLDDRIERERLCTNCGHRWKTAELFDADVARLRAVGEAVQKAARLLGE